MIRLFIGGLALVTIGLCVTAEQAPTTKAPASQSAVAPVELVVLGDDKIARVQISVEVDGKSLSAIWDETFARLHAFFDRNGDGFLDAKEAARLPAPLALRQAMGSGFTPPVGSAPAFADLDRDGDGKVAVSELAAFYRRASIGNIFIGFGRLPASAELTGALLKNLDTDCDGKVTEKEWKAAADALKKLDKNDDELIGVGELVPKVVYPGVAGTTLLASPKAKSALPESLAKLPLILLPADDADTQWASIIVQRRSRKGDGTLTPNEAGLSAALFKHLDTDKDDKLTAKELAAWRKQDPDPRCVIRFGKKTTSMDRFTFNGGRLRIDGWVNDGTMPDLVASARRELLNQFDIPAPPKEGPKEPGKRRGNLAWLTPIADRDGDGTLDRKELEAWLDLQQQIARGQVMLTILESGVGLFELLDTNHDGALSARDLRGAWDRIREAGCLTDGAFDRAKAPRILLAAVSHGYPKSFGIDMRRGPAWFRAMDRNGDGDVSRREWIGDPALFDRYDLNRDGLLSPAEAEKVVPKQK